MKINVKNNIFIIILLFVLIILVVMYLQKFIYDTKANQLVKTSLAAQAKISEYIGKMKSDTFDIYTMQQIIVGSSDLDNVDTTKIKDNKDNDLSQIVSMDDKITCNNQVFYKLNVNNFENLFNIKLYNEDSIKWYISGTGDIKVNYINRPIWWNQVLDVLYIGD